MSKKTGTTITLLALVSLSVLGLVIGPTLVTSSQTKPDISAPTGYEGACRFAIAVPRGTDGYDIESIGVGSLLNWGVGAGPERPEDVDYIHVLRVRSDLYANTKAGLPNLLNSYPGSVWLVGNEPDTIYEGQDGVTAEVYAQRFHELATIIRAQDPTAKIGFGSIVQPTPIRMRYLDRAWDELVSLASGASAASALIDIWSIHSFILNEQPGEWGTGVPPGFESDYDDAIKITNFADTHSIALFEARVEAFRDWMNSKGERHKPLWITEYGSLLPPIDPPGCTEDYCNYVNVSDATTAAFMVDTFDFMLSATDSSTGLPSDGNRLVQRWFWYSLNDYRYNFGGSLYDPDNNKAITHVGEEFRDYTNFTHAQPDLYPVDLTLTETSANTYQITVTVANAPDADTGSGGQVWIYDADPDKGGNLIAGPLDFDWLQRCGDTTQVTTSWTPSSTTSLTNQDMPDSLYVTVTPVGVGDSDPTNNTLEFTLRYHVYVPLVIHNFGKSYEVYVPLVIKGD